MSVERFLRLQADFCEVAAAPVPDLAPDERGMLAFHAAMRGYWADCFFAPAMSATDAFVMADLGAMPAGTDGAAWQVLLHSNALMFSKAAPAFALTETGRLKLQWVYPLDVATGHDLYATLMRCADWADQWHAGHFDGGGLPLAVPVTTRA